MGGQRGGDSWQVCVQGAQGRVTSVVCAGGLLAGVCAGVRGTSGRCVLCVQGGQGVGDILAMLGRAW